MFAGRLIYRLLDKPSIHFIHSDMRAIVEFISLFFAGMLAGEEFIVRYGLSTLLTAMDDQPHIRLRQSLIRRLRLIVPIIFLATLASAIASLILDGGSSGSFNLRCGGLCVLFIWIAITLIGTVPINKNVLEWRPAVLPVNWKALIIRWQRLDTWRAWLAILAFVFFLAAVVR
jgi:hypothetical protein